MLRGFDRDRAGPAQRLEPVGSVTDLLPARKLQGEKAIHRLMDRLTAQQASLVRAISLRDEDYLNHSYYLEAETEKRIAYELEEEDLSRFTALWWVAPIECIRALNQAIRSISEPIRRERYLRAAVELEILMDQHSWADGDGKVYRGIPSYLMNGYTDMGTRASPTERNGREKLKVDKMQIKDRLVGCKREGVAVERAGVGVLARFYNTVRRDIEFNEQGVEKLSHEHGNKSIVLSEYLDKGMGVWRHLSIFFQLYAQEAGIHSRVVKGNLRLYIFSGRHAWNMVQVGDQAALVDVTHPNLNDPFIIVGSPEAEVYERANDFSRSYVATSDEENHYKIGT